jgi:F-type H+-transporting ATPase subunit delta
MKKDKTTIIEDALTLMESEKGEEFVDQFHKSLIGVVEKTKGIFDARVESAVELTADEKKKIEDLLSQILKNRVAISYHVKPHIIGGFRITVGDWKLDATVTNQIEQMQSLLKG